MMDSVTTVTFAVRWLLDYGDQPDGTKPVRVPELNNSLHTDAATIGYNLIDEEYCEQMIDILVWSCDRPVS